MAIIRALLEALPATIEAISGYSRVVPSIRKWFEHYPNAFSFINAGVKLYGNAYRSMFGEVYRVYTYFRNQGSYLNMVDPQTPIDPRLAYEIPTPTLEMPLGGQYRYGVEYQVWIPQHQQWVTRNVWVPSRYPLTPEGITIQGLIPLNINLVKYKLKIGEEDLENDAIVRGVRVTSFTRFIPE